MVKWPFGRILHLYSQENLNENMLQNGMNVDILEYVTFSEKMDKQRILPLRKFV